MLKIILLMLATSLFVGCETTTTRLLGNEDLEGTHWDGLELGDADTSMMASSHIICSNDSNNCSIMVVDADSNIVYFSQSMNDGDGKYDLTENVNFPEDSASWMFTNGKGYFIENGPDSSYYGNVTIATSYGKYFTTDHLPFFTDAYTNFAVKYTVIEWDGCPSRGHRNIQDLYSDAVFNLYCDSQNRPLTFVITNKEYTQDWQQAEREFNSVVDKFK